MLRRASARGFTLWAVTPAEEAEIHGGLFAGLENGTLRPIVGKELALAEAARAHKEILEPGAAGKSSLCLNGLLPAPAVSGALTGGEPAL